MKSRFLIAIVTCLAFFAAQAQDDESASELQLEQKPEINEARFDEVVTPGTWEKTLAELESAKQPAQKKRVIEGLKETFWEISGKDQDNYFLVVHSFFRQYPRVSTEYKTDKYQDEFDLLYEELETTYIP